MTWRLAAPVPAATSGARRNVATTITKRFSAAVSQGVTKRVASLGSSGSGGAWASYWGSSWGSAWGSAVAAITGITCRVTITSSLQLEGDMAGDFLLEDGGQLSLEGYVPFYPAINIRRISGPVT
jgi:hypothetical protein